MRRSLLLVAALVLSALPAVAGGRAGTTGLAHTGGERAFFVVSFSSRITDRARSAVVETGLRVVDYEPVNAYVVWGTEAEAARASRLPEIRSVEAVRVERKLHPSVAGHPVPLVAVTVHGPSVERIVPLLETVGAVEATFRIRADGLLATVHLRPAVPVERIARHPSVLFVGPASTGLVPEDEATDQIQAGNLDPSSGLPLPDYPSWLRSVGLDGSGVRVAVVDTGISPVHPDFGGRVVATYDYANFGGAANPLDPFDDGGHGTHVAGIVGGAPPADATLRDGRGYAYGIGVAPGVSFVNQNALARGARFPPRAGFERLSADAWNAGARMWNASWQTGEGARVGYIPTVRTMDEIARNADFDTAGSEEFLLVFSAGNAGAAGPTAPHEAKNIIAVGASISGRTMGIAEVRARGDAVASFSSRGPTQDGRIFPTVVAPGDEVVSARAPESALACIPPPLGAGLYTTCSGTSMAAPHVTGAAALIHQWWARTNNALPSPAMVKALLVNGAVDMAQPNIPNVNEGWGRVNLGNVFAAGPAVYRDQATVFTEPGDEAATVVRVADPSRPLKVTLAWTDAPAGVFAAPALVNDLDLVVERLDDDGMAVDRWLGNVFAGGVSVSGGAPDRLNNLENVFVDAPAAGRYRISVRAENLPGDGIPENGDETDQDFVLVVRNAE